MIHLLSTWSAAYHPLAELTYFKNKLLYANKHGYGSIYDVHEDDSDICWDRIRKWLAALNSIKENDWLLFTGTDLLVTQPSYKLEDYIDDKYELICCVDKYQVFGDCLLFKACKNIKNLLQEILDRKSEFANEQLALSTILSKSTAFEFYCNKVGSIAGTKEFYDRSEDILNTSQVRVKVLNPLVDKKICGDLPWVHDWNDAIVPSYHAWYEDTFSLHIGGKSLHFRLGLVPLLLQNIKFDNIIDIP